MTVRLTYPIATLAAVMPRLMSALEARRDFTVEIDSVDSDEWHLSIALTASYPHQSEREVQLGFAAGGLWWRTFHQVDKRKEWKKGYWSDQQDQELVLAQLCERVLDHFTKDYTS
jgi:hypothetical protein